MHATGGGGEGGGGGPEQCTRGEAEREEAEDPPSDDILCLDARDTVPLACVCASSFSEFFLTYFQVREEQADIGRRPGCGLA